MATEVRLPGQRYQWTQWLLDAAPFKHPSFLASKMDESSSAYRCATPSSFLSDKQGGIPDLATDRTHHHLRAHEALDGCSAFGRSCPEGPCPAAEEIN